MFKDLELIKEYDAPNYENIRQNLRNHELLNYIKITGGAFFRFKNKEQIYDAIVADELSAVENLLKYIDEKDEYVFMDLKKDVFVPEESLQKISKKIKLKLDCNAYCYLKNDIEAENLENIKPLNISQAEFIFDNYNEKETSSLIEIKEYIKRGPALGYYQDEKLLGFVLVHDDGQIGVLQVLNEYRRQGIAKKLMKAITKEVLNLRRVPGLEVLIGNEASISLVTSIGFEHLGQELWLIF